MKNKEKERIMNLSMRYCTAFLGGMAVNTSVLSKVLDELFTNKQVIAMSLDKAIEHGKEKRKPYYGAQAIIEQTNLNEQGYFTVINCTDVDRITVFQRNKQQLILGFIAIV